MYKTEEPDAILHCQRILAIPMQRCAPTAVEYLSSDELAAMISHGLWVSRFGSDSSVLGTTITLGGRPHTVRFAVAGILVLCVAYLAALPAVLPQAIGWPEPFNTHTKGE